MVDFFNETFNNISFVLNIEANEVPQNEIEPILSPNAIIMDVSIGSILEWNDDELRYTNPRDLSRIGYEQQEITLKNAHSIKVYQAQNDISFTFQDLITIIEDFSRETRQQMRYMGGPDIYNITFDGLRINDDGTFTPEWI